MIIEYHRIGNFPFACSLEKFEEQVIRAKKIGMLLTFDDGLKEHIRILPILKKYDMKGLFFIPTKRDRLLDPHKVWLLRPHFKWDRVEVEEKKFYLQTHPKELQQVFDKYFDEIKEAKKMYMTWDEVRELKDAGMTIGCHSHTHPWLTLLSEEEQEKEIKLSTEILTEEVAKPFAFSYPYGFGNKITLRLLKKYGYKWVVLSAPELGRIDCNDF